VDEEIIELLDMVGSEHSDDVWIQAALIAENLANGNVLQDVCRRWAFAKPDSALRFLCLAWIELLRNRRFDLAITNAKSCLKLSPESACVRFTLSEASLGVGKWLDCFAEIREILSSLSAALESSWVRFGSSVSPIEWATDRDPNGGESTGLKSGQFIGFYLEGAPPEHLGPMFVTLHVSKDKVNGRGTDPVGSFTLNGDTDRSGVLTLVKSYAGRHAVRYRSLVKNGAILGRFDIDLRTIGTIALWPDIQESSS